MYGFKNIEIRNFRSIDYQEERYRNYKNPQHWNLDTEYWKPLMTVHVDMRVK